MSYKIHFVNDEEFESLPGNGMESKVGVAYPESGEAYIRKSGSSLVDVFTLAHELEHLDGDTLEENYDSENHAYYKGFGDVVRPIAQVASVIPGPWQPFAAATQVGMGIHDARKARKQQQGAMDQFQAPSYGPQAQMTPSFEARPPAISTPRQFQTGGNMGSSGEESGIGGASRLGNLARSLIGQNQQNRNQYGFYSGRNVPYGGF